MGDLQIFGQQQEASIANLDTSFGHQAENNGLAGLPYTVIRIRGGDLSNSNQFHTGTGFFYLASDPSGEIPLVVSNKHVLCGKAWIELDFALGTSHGSRIFGPPTTFRIAGGQLSIFEHPDPSVDLAAVPLAAILQGFDQVGQIIHAAMLNAVNFAPPHLINEMRVATNVLMVGFPNGVMDEANNLPVVRRGILATPYVSDYGGQSNFVVDIASFGGSSGSPVFALFENMVPDGHGNINLLTGPQIYLIGVLHSGPVMNASGNIIAVPIPTNHFVSQTSIMIHLGYCLKAFRIEELALQILEVNAHSLA